MTQQTTPPTGHSRATDAGRHTHPATGAVAIVAGPAPDRGRLEDLVAERFAPVFQPGIDPAAQVQRVVLPAPGDGRELSGAIACAMEEPLPPGRPRWECRIIEGLQNDRWAMLIKAGQTLARDYPPAHLLARLCDNAGPTVFTNHVAAERLSPGPSDTPGWADTVWQTAGRALDGLAFAAGARRLWPAAAARPTMRRYRTAVAARAAADHISRKFGVSADDVAFAAITEGFRSVLIKRGEQPRADALHTLGPASTHLPVQYRDPLAQLRAIRAQSRTASSADSPLARCDRAIHALARPSRHVVTLATTPSGPQFPLLLTGRRLERVLPIAPVNAGTGVAILSYGPELVFGITADYGTALDIDQLAAGIESGMARLVALTEDSVVPFDRGRKRRVRTLPNGAARWRPSAAPVWVRH